MAFPDFMEIDIRQKGYYSANWKEGDANCNILIHILDSAESTSADSKEQMLLQRDKDGRNYLQMDSLGIFYIGTSKMFEQSHSPYQLGKHKGSKINGWWVIDGQFRGGPYTRYTLYHAPSKQWISLEALVYYPPVDNRNDGKSKTRYLRTLESIIHTLK